MKGTLDISRSQNFDGNAEMRLRIEDGLSGTRIIYAVLSPHDLMMAITGRSAVPVEFEFTEHPGRIGKVREQKEVPLVVDKAPGTEEGKFALAEAAREHEVDGWINTTHGGSHQGWSQGQVENLGASWAVRCRFVRFVEPVTITSGDPL